MKKIILNIAMATFAICANMNANAQIIRTLAGNGTLGETGDHGPAYSASIGTSWGIAMDHRGNIYVADDYLNLIRKVSPNGTITTVAGTGYPGYTGDGGPATAAHLNYPSGLAVDRYNNVYFADNANFSVRKIDTAGIITTVAGDGSGRHGYSGDGGPAVSARLMGCVGVAFDNIGNLYITDGNTTVRKVDTGGIITTIAGSTSWGFYGSEIAATAASLAGPCGITVDNSGNIYFSDQSDNRIRKIDVYGMITTFAGTGAAGFTGDGGSAVSARINTPSGLATDDSGNVYFADESNNRIRKINTSGIITTVAGTGGWNYTGDGGTATAATMKAPSEICIGPNGNMYITDRRNYAVREIINQNTIPLSVSAGNNICAGIIDTFAAPLANCNYGLVSQWMLNGAVAGTATTQYINASLHTGDVVTYSLLDPLYHFVTDSSYAVTMTVNPVVTPSVTIAASTSDTICSSTPVTFTATPTFGGSTPTYQWQVNGVSAGTAISYTYVPAAGDVIKAIMNSSVACPTSPTVSSSGITMTVNPLVTPGVSIAATASSLCDGNTASFTATGINGGTAPVYQWKKFGTNIGTGTTYSYIPANGDNISCELTSNAACRTADSAGAAVSMTVNPSVTPSVNIVSTPTDRVDYAGELVTFYSEVTYGGSVTTYQWVVNGLPIAGATASSYSANVFSTDTVICQVTSNAVCATSASAASNPLVIHADNNLSVNEVNTATGSYTLYPNPNNGSFVLGGTITTANEEISFEVYDMTGKLILNGKTTPQNGQPHEQINLDNTVTTGQYLLRVITKNDDKTMHFAVNK